MTPPVFVVDTNVVMSGMTSKRDDSPPVAVLHAMLSGSLVYLLSPALLAEYRSVLLRPKIAGRHGLSEEQIDVVLAEIVSNAMWRSPAKSVTAPDRGDDHLWALLAEHPDSTLITADKLLLDAPAPGSAAILPSAWVERP